jgi:hypothetical protein
MKLTIPASIDSIATRADNTIKIIISTQEMPPEDAVVLFRLKGGYGWLSFSDEYITDIGTMPEPPKMDGKTPAQRLRATMFVCWSELTDKKIPFENYYNSAIEKIIDQFKDKLKD